MSKELLVTYEEDEIQRAKFWLFQLNGNAFYLPIHFVQKCRDMIYDDRCHDN